jgi:D-glycero-alpha-D-manno-heptose-7-phosphate kinase
MIVVQTPLRVSFLGGGTDFEDFYSIDGGAVLSAAIDKYIFVIVKERFDDMIYINYSEKEIVDKVDSLKHELVREAMRMTGVQGGIEITTLADVPSEGSGLGSSSSITVGLLQALYAYQGESRIAEALAEEACRIEIGILKKPIGKQDQYIAAYGNMQLIHFNNEGPKPEKVLLSKEGKTRLSERLMLFYTGMTRNSGTILEEQKTNINKHCGILGEMRELAFKGKDALAEGAFDDFGEMLHQGWELKKQLASKITNPEIDEMYEAACRAGALGGKISGAGGGGFLLLYCPNGRKEEVRGALRGLRELPFSFEPDGSKVIFNYRR